MREIDLPYDRLKRRGYGRRNGKLGSPFVDNVSILSDERYIYIGYWVVRVFSKDTWEEVAIFPECDELILLDGNYLYAKTPITYEYSDYDNEDPDVIYEMKVYDRESLKEVELTETGLEKSDIENRVRFPKSVYDESDEVTQSFYRLWEGNIRGIDKEERNHLFNKMAEKQVGFVPKLQRPYDGKDRFNPSQPDTNPFNKGDYMYKLEEYNIVTYPETGPQRRKVQAWVAIRVYRTIPLDGLQHLEPFKGIESFPLEIATLDTGFEPGNCVYTMQNACADSKYIYAGIIHSSPSRWVSQMQIWENWTWKKVKTFEIEEEVRCLHVDDKYLYIGTNYNGIKIVSKKTFNEIAVLADFDKVIFPVTP